MFREMKFRTRGVSINYAEGPVSGPPVVLLHGIPGRWQEFLPIIPPLIVQWHVYAVDLRGQGKSSHGGGDYHLTSYGPDLVPWLKHVVAEPAVLLGNSAGGAVALDVAARAPDCVRAVILGDMPNDVDAVLGWMKSAEFLALYSALRALAASGLTVPEMVRELAAIPVAVSPQGAAIRYGDLPDHDQAALTQLAVTLRDLDPDVLEYHAEGRPEEFLAGLDLDRLWQSVRCPTLLLQANPALGGMMTDRGAARALELLEQGTHVCVYEFGHGLGLDQWQVGPLLRALTAFLDSV